MIFKRHNKRDGITYWFTRYTLPDGRKKQERAGTRKQDAVDLETLRKSEILKGTYIEPGSVDADNLLVSEFYDLFMERFGGTKRSRHYQNSLAPALEYFECCRIKDIKAGDCAAYSAWLKTSTSRRGKSKRVISQGTHRKRLIALGTFFNKAIVWGVVEASPMAGLKKPGDPSGRKAFLAPADLQALLAAAPDGLANMYRLAVAQGLRLKEACNLRWSDISTSAGVLYVFFVFCQW